MLEHLIHHLNHFYRRPFSSFKGAPGLRINEVACDDQAFWILGGVMMAYGRLTLPYRHPIWVGSGIPVVATVLPNLVSAPSWPSGARWPAIRVWMSS